MQYGKYLLFCSIVLCFAVSLSPLPADSSTLSEVVFGCDADYSPMSYLDEGGPAGFDIELIKYVSQDSGLSSEIILADWATTLQGLEGGEIDVVSAVVKTPARSVKFDFSIPYIREAYAVFIADDSDIKSLNELEGRRLSVPAGDAIIETFVIPNDMQDNLIDSSSYTESLRHVAEGQADFTIAPYSLGSDSISFYGLKLVESSERSLFTVDYRYAVRKGEPELLYTLNESLNKLSTAGMIDELYERSGFTRQFSLSSTQPRTSVFIIATVSILLVMTAVVIHLLSRRELLTKIGRYHRKNLFLRKLISDLPADFFYEIRGNEGSFVLDSSENLPEDAVRAAEDVLTSGKSSTLTLQVADQEWKRFSYIPVNYQRLGLCGVAALITDCSAEMKCSAKLEQLAAELAYREVELAGLRMSDSLTGLFNLQYVREKTVENFELAGTAARPLQLQEVRILSGGIESGADDYVSADLLRRFGAELLAGAQAADIVAYAGMGSFIILRYADYNEEAEEFSEDLLERIERRFPSLTLDSCRWNIPDDIRRLPERFSRIFNFERITADEKR